MEDSPRGLVRSYYGRRAAGLLAGMSIDKAKELALEIIIAEMHIKQYLRECSLTAHEKTALEEALRDIECAKNILYRAYRLGFIRTARRRER